VNAAVIVAGGVGERFGDPRGKQLAPVGGLPVLAHTLRAFERCDVVDAIVVVTHPDRVETYRAEAVGPSGAGKVIAVVPGGATRTASVAAGLAALPRSCVAVAVHDGARAAVTPETIAAGFAALYADPLLDGVVVGHPALDTIKEADPDGRVISTPDRSRLWVAQTPQTFRLQSLLRAHATARRDGFEGTDDASLVERCGGTVSMLEGPRWNIKVTRPEDLPVLSALLRERGEVAGDV
jgi:2-C-methyl-D-erythritol 4-phosphate cytidylyltransferase